MDRYVYILHGFFSQGYAPFLDVENSLKTILDNIEQQTGKPDYSIQIFSFLRQCWWINFKKLIY